MKKVLVAYATMAGSTADVAKTVGEEIAKSGAHLKWWAVLFAMLIIQAPAGDRRNWAAIRAWAAGLPVALKIDG
jgi:hypothetical protein